MTILESPISKIKNRCYHLFVPPGKKGLSAIVITIYENSINEKSKFDVFSYYSSGRGGGGICDNSEIPDNPKWTFVVFTIFFLGDRKSTRLNSSHNA